MPYTPEQIAKLKATDPAIVRKALERMSEPDRAELLQVLKGEAPAAPRMEMEPSHAVAPEAAATSTMTPSHVTGEAAVPTEGEGGVLGWIKGKVNESETRRQEIMKNPLAAIANVPVSYANLGSLLRTFRESTGEQTPYGIEKYLADPTLGSVAKGIADAPIKVAQLAQHTEALGGRAFEAATGAQPLPQTGPMISDRLANYVDELYKDPAVVQSLTGEIIGQALLPGQLATKGAAVVSEAPLAARVARGALTGATMGVTATPDVGVTSEEDFWKRQVAPAATGAALGGLGGAVKAPSVSATPEAIAEAEQAGIKVLTSDVAPPRTFAGKWLQGIGEKIPYVGTGGMRKAQQAQRIEAVSNLLGEYGVLGVDPEDAAKPLERVFKDLAGRRSELLTKYSGMKSEVIKRMDDLGTVPMPKTTSAIDAEITRLQSLKNKDANAIIEVLSDWKTSIQDQSMSNIETLRSQIGKAFDAPSLVSSKDMAGKSLSGIYKFVRDDMGDFINANGRKQDFNKWSIANKRLSEMAGEVKTGALRSVLKSGEMAAEDVGKMLFSSKPSEVRQLVSGLTPTGRENAKMAVLAKVADQAGDAESLSPEKFISAVRKLGSPIGIVFEGQEVDRIRGLSRALKLTSQASKASLAPPTGVQGLPLLAGGALTALFGPTGAASAVVGAGGMARAYESAPVRNLLMSLSKVKAGSPEETALFKRLVQATQSHQNDKRENQ